MNRTARRTQRKRLLLRITLITCLVTCLATIAAGAEESMVKPDADRPEGVEAPVPRYEAPDFDALWDYDDPEATRHRFEAIQRQTDAAPVEYRLELLTQIARAHGLAGHFDAAHAVLDDVERALPDTPGIVGVRYLLERGRAFRSGGAPDRAQPLFEEAFEQATQVEADYHAVDAAHMLAITVDSEAARRDWSERGLAVAEASTQRRARHWLGSIYNNLGWDRHEEGEFDEALDLFRKALAAREEEGDTKLVGIARWCVARCLRSLERYDESLAIQQALHEALAAAGTSDGYVSEELAEIHLALGDSARAARHFAEAHHLLSENEWFAENEQARLERMVQLSRQR